MESESKGLVKIGAAILAGAAMIGGSYLVITPTPTAAPTTWSTSFEFNPSPSTNIDHYNVYYGSLRENRTNFANIGNNLSFTLVTSYRDVHAVVTAVDTGGNESEPSNPAGVIRGGVQDRVIAQTTLDLTNWTDLPDVVAVITNYNEQQLFYKLRIERTNKTMVYP